jgi:AI-2 transport protein TqsA
MLKSAEDSVLRNAMVVVAVVVAGAALYWLRGILTPLALAIFLMIMIDSFVRVLQSRAPLLPSWAAMPLALVVGVALFALTAFLIADNAAAFASQITSYGPKLDGLLARISAAVGIGFPSSLDQLLDRLNPTR